MRYCPLIAQAGAQMYTAYVYGGQKTKSPDCASLYFEP